MKFFCRNEEKFVGSIELVEILQANDRAEIAQNIINNSGLHQDGKLTADGR